MAKWREESGKPIKGAKDDPNPASGDVHPTTTGPISPPATTAPARHERAAGRRARDGEGPRTGVRRVSDVAADLVGVVAMIICVLLALHIAFVVFSANDDNAIVRTVNDLAGRFAWRFHDIFVPKDERVGALVNYGIAAVVYLVAGRVVSGLIRRVR
jgi:hypothetical protein